MIGRVSGDDDNDRSGLISCKTESSLERNKFLKIFSIKLKKNLLQHFEINGIQDFKINLT